ncbi:MAG: helix-turn-helix domain-containing protein [Bacteroidales bacterium]|nr:helix-turn-helix domain-containing protein [Bacteroidales bacterium]
MSRYQEKTYGEISSELGISKKTVQYHISRVLEKLRKLLK